MELLHLLSDPFYLVTTVVAFLILLYVIKGKRYTNLPPGPKPWPIVGNLPYMRQGLALHQVAFNLRREYGDVVRLKLGPITDLVLIMGQEKIHKAAVTMNDKFKYRPTTFLFNTYVFRNKGILFANGDVHSALRKFTLGSLRDFGVEKKSLEERIQEEAGMLSEAIAKLEGKPAYMLNDFKMAVANIIAGIVYGNRLEYDDPVFHRLVAKIEQIFRVLSVLLPENLLPALRYLPSSKVVGTGRNIRLEDKKDMPYLQAFIKEVLRKKCSITNISKMELLHLFSDPFYLVTAVVAFLILLYVIKGKRYTNLPPGPKPWPFVGNLPYMRKGLALHEVALNLRREYGDVVRLKLGPITDLVLIMGQEKIHKAAVTMNDKFKYRPATFFVNKYIFKNHGILFANGDTHSALRKFTLGALRDFGVGKKSLQERIQEEAGMLCEVIVKQEGKPAYMLNDFKMAVANIIAGIVYGSRLEYDDPVFHGLVAKIDKIFKDLSILLPENIIPALRFLPGSKLGKVMKILNDLGNYARGRIEEHRSTFDPDNLRDFVDLFLKYEGSEDEAITEDNLFRIIIDLFNAGTDTTATTIVWAIVHLIRHPDIQDKCRKEVLQVVGTERFIRLEDKKDMPYLQAFINEVLRYSTIAPQTIPHSVLEDTDFEGYTIPKNSVVMFVLYTILLDKETWGDPDNFRPERFLSETGQLVEDKESFAPFGLGGRSCLGRHLARMELFIFLGTLIQRFEFKSPLGSPPPSTRRIQTGITSQPEKYDVCAIPLNK